MTRVIQFVLVAIFFIVSGIKAQQPSFEWVKRVGSSGMDFADAAALDITGNVYVTGYFGGLADFDPGPSSFTMDAVSNADIYVAKYDPAGNFIWAKQLPSIFSTGSGRGTSIAVDKKGNVYVTGYFTLAMDFDPGPGTYTMSTSYENGFILKLDALGNFVWAEQMGYAFGSQPNGISIDTLRGVYVTGASLTSSISDPDIFVSKVDGTTGGQIWSKSFASTATDKGNAITCDEIGRIYTTGFFQDTIDFDPGSSVFNLSSDGYGGFIIKMDSSGNFIWANTLDSTGFAEGKSIKLDGLGNIHVTGGFQNIVDFDPGPATYTINSGGSIKAFIVKFNPSGNFLWARGLGGGYAGASIAFDGLNSVYTIGNFNLTRDFDPGPAVFNLSSGGGQDIYISKLDAFGNFVWAKSINGWGIDYCGDILVNWIDEVYTVGSFDQQTDFDPGTPVAYVATMGGSDFFIQKLSNQTGVEEIQINENIKLFPNPSNGSLFFNLDESAEFIITNVFGEEILRQKTISGQNEINIKTQPSGIYFITLMNEQLQKIGSAKFIKQ